MKPIFKIIEGPKVISVGANGAIFSGVKVMRTTPKKERGYQKEWYINNITFAKAKEEVMEKFGMGEGEYDKINCELQKLTEAEKEINS